MAAMAGGIPVDQTSRLLMSLCHICSSWRTIVLGSPRLWAYLYYHLPIHWEDGRPVAWDSKIFLHDMQCLKWWRQNQGSMAPFIRFEFYQAQGDTYTQFQGLPLMRGDIQFFVEYLSSAKYLDVGPFAIYVFQQDPLYKSFQASCQNHQSLVVRNYTISDENGNMRRKPSFAPFHIAPTLRRLRMHDVEISPNYMKTFTQCSGLTHLSLHDIFMFPDVWHSLIRTVPNLQWAYFDIFLELNDNNYDPPQFTLLYLDTLSVTLDNSDEDVKENPLGQLLINLHLPALRDFSIYIDADPRNLLIVAKKINDGLTSTPAVTKLTLAFRFLGFIELGVPKTKWGRVDKLSMLVPRLAHLVLDTCYIHRYSEYEPMLSRRLVCWKEFFHPMSWLDLANPASTLRKISVVVREPSRDGPLIESAIRGALELDKKPKAALEIVPEDKKGLAPYAQGYKTWGCSL